MGRNVTLSIGALILIIIVMVGRDRITRWQTLLPALVRKLQPAKQAGGGQ